MLGSAKGQVAGSHQANNRPLPAGLVASRWNSGRCGPADWRCNPAVAICDSWPARSVNPRDTQRGLWFCQEPVWRPLVLGRSCPGKSCRLWRGCRFRPAAVPGPCRGRCLYRRLDPHRARAAGLCPTMRGSIRRILIRYSDPGEPDNGRDGKPAKGCDCPQMFVTRSSTSRRLPCRD